MTGSAGEIAAAIAVRQSFIITSHARPDGDAIGSSVALALALDRLGKRATVVLKDPVPAPYRSFPGIDRIVFAARVDEPADAAVLLECTELGRAEVGGLDRYFLVNVDHHTGNGLYGAVNWFDESAAACGEMVAAIIDALGVPWTRDIASHLYLALATDTGGFRYGPISARTFDICRRIAAAGVETARLARAIFDSFSIGRVKLTGSLLTGMDLRHANHLALLSLDDDLLRQCGATMDDTEGLVNLPLGAREVVAVALFKEQSAGVFRVSLRSKGDVDMRGVAAMWQGGGHRNAAACTATGHLAALKDAFAEAMGRAIESAKYEVSAVS